MKRKESFSKLNIVITGTPGVGKTTIARALSEKLGLKLMELNKLAKDIGAINGMDERREAQIINEGKIRRELEKILSKDYGYVIEGHWGEIVPKKFVDYVIVIRTHPLVLMERLRKRGYSEGKIRENAQSELLDYCLIKSVEAFGEERVFEYDNTKGDLEEVIREIIKMIEEGVGPKPGSINWIEILEREGKIKEIL
ncbi:MAG: adenylate kinase family protein [Candidatus Methanomethyliaceae archaeon]|nr:adenylate kinase family protein [Candidatus Methanomethyliaceae archaeon]MDW7971505.1 adenylate kinase family protein [Nitrososphaerota archaeon]